MQHEIMEAHPLLDENSNLVEAGYCKKLLPVYNKKTDFKSRFHTKEWDYYYIGNDRFGLALTIDDNGYMAQDTVSLLSFAPKFAVTRSEMQLMTLGKKNLPSTSEKGDVEWQTKKYHLKFENDGTKRHLSGYMNNFIADVPITFDVTLTEIPEESMVICTPFEKDGHFYYNQKINCMRAEGKIVTGPTEYVFDPKDSFGTLDWGRGIWTYSNTWYWSSLSTVVDGHRFGFNLGYGFGNTAAATENMLFYDGKAHKLEHVDFGMPKNKKGKEIVDGTWHFTSSDGRVTLDFKPIIDRFAAANVAVIKSVQHQVFGRFYGQCILDDGTVIKLDGPVGFAEKVANRW